MDSGKQTAESTKPKKIEPELKATKFLLVPHTTTGYPNPRDSSAPSRTPEPVAPSRDNSVPSETPEPEAPPLVYPHNLRPRKIAFTFCAVILLLLTSQFASNIAQTKLFSDLVEIESRLENPTKQQSSLATCIVNNKSKTLTLICKNANTRQYSLRYLDLDTCNFG